jgi:hypothetical protein
MELEYVKPYLHSPICLQDATLSAATLLPLQAGNVDLVIIYRTHLDLLQQLVLRQFVFAGDVDAMTLQQLHACRIYSVADQYVSQWNGHDFSKPIYLPTNPVFFNMFQYLNV